jgi:hypothetical protein
MPINWTISHPQRAVSVEVEGEISLAEVEEYLDALVVADAMPYAKLVDCRKMTTHWNDDEVMNLGARIRAYASVMKGGPVVFVVATPEINDYARRYINLTTAERPVKIVSSLEAARTWLSAQQA